jgi:hypothetical protein
MPQDNLMQNSTRLNTQQLEMLRLFVHPMPEKVYDEIKRFVVKMLAENIDVEMERLEKEKGWTQETYEQWGKEHLRTSYKK